MSYVKVPFPEQPACPVDLEGEPCLVDEEKVQVVAETQVSFLALVLEALFGGGYVSRADMEEHDRNAAIAKGMKKLMGDDDDEDYDANGGGWQIEFDPRLNCWVLRDGCYLFALEDCCALPKTFTPASPHPVKDKVINCGSIKIAASIALLKEKKYGKDDELVKIENFPVHIHAPYQLVEDVEGAEPDDFVCEELEEVLGCRTCCFLQTVDLFGEILIDEPQVAFKVPMIVRRKVVRIPQREMEMCPPEKDKKKKKVHYPKKKKNLWAKKKMKKYIISEKCCL